MRNQLSDHSMRAPRRSSVAPKAMRPRNSNFDLSPARCSRGTIMPMLVVSLAAMIGMAGLALDMGHVYFKKSEYQNAADAAALSAYKTYETSSGTPAQKAALASNEAVTVFQAHLSGVTPVVRFSASLAEADATCSNFPYLAGSVPSSATTMFVCVGAELNLPLWLTRVLPSAASNMTVPGSAVAGRTGTVPQVCSNIPIVYCSSEDPPVSTPGDWYQDNTLRILYDPTKLDYYLAKVGYNPAIDCKGAGDTFDFPTSSGITVGNMAKGANVRMDIYPSGNIDWPDPIPPSTFSQTYPSDAIVYKNGINYRYSQYKQDIIDNARLPWAQDGIPGRRILRMATGSCTNTQITLRNVLCFFMIKEANSDGDKLYGEFIPDQDCPEQVSSENWYDPGGSSSTSQPRIVLFR